MAPSSSTIVYENMTGKVNEGNGVCLGGCWGVGGVSESDMRGGGDDPTDIPLFVSGLPRNYQHSLPEGRGAKKTVPV